MIKLFTDSSSYIPMDLLVEHNITVLPVSVVLSGKEIYETDISNDTFYSTIKQTRQMPKTKPVSYESALAAFEDAASRGHSIIGIFVSTKLGETYNNAMKARQKVLDKYPKAHIKIIDSHSTCMQEGMAVLAAAEAIKKGEWFERVIEAAYETMRRTKFLMMPASLVFLEISGKISKVQAALGGMMQISPILTAEDSEVKLVERVHSKNRTINKSLEIFKNDADKYGLDYVYISHIDAIDAAMDLAEKIKKLYDVEIGISDIGPAIGGHAGPGTIGIAYKTLNPFDSEA